MSTSNTLLRRLRRAGTPAKTAPDIDAIIARAAQRRRRRQIGVTAASVVVVGGLGVGSARLIAQGQTTSETISAAGTAPSALGPPAEEADTAASAAQTSTTSISADSQTLANTDSVVVSTPPTTASPADADSDPDNQVTTDATRSMLRAALGDGIDGTLSVSHGAILHHRADGSFTALALPESDAPIQRHVTDVAMLDGRPFLLVHDFIDRPDLVEQNLAEMSERPSTDVVADLIHQELSIYAVDLTTDEVHIVEQRTITDRTSPEWVYNGHITVQNDHLMVVRELWQDLCVYVEGLDLYGNPVSTNESPLPQPALDGLADATIRSMMAGTLDPPAGCIGIDELPDGAMSVLGVEADPVAIDAMNAELSGLS